MIAEKTKLVSVFTPLNESEDMIARSILEEAGIPYFTKNSTLQNLFGMGQIGTGYNLITGPVRIQVYRKDKEKAQALIRSRLEDADASIMAPEICPACNCNTAQADQCPSCGLQFRAENDIPAAPEEKITDSLSQERQVKKYILRSFIFNWLWIFGLGHILGIHYALKALGVIKASPQKLKGKIFALLLLFFGMAGFLTTFIYILLLATGNKAW